MPSSSNSARPCAGGKSQQPQGVDSTVSSMSSKDKASTSPPTRSSRFQGFSASASNGITSIANASAEPPQAGSSAAAVQIPNHLELSGPIWGRFQELKRPPGSSKNKVPVPLSSRRVDKKAAQVTSAVPLIGDQKTPNLLRRFRRPKRHNTDPLPFKPLTEKEPFPPPPASINTVLTDFRPPSSAYVSPQDPASSSYHPKAKRKMGASHTSGDASAGLALSSAHDVSGAHGKGKRGRKRSDPHPVGSTLSSGSSKGKASTSPPTTRSTRSQRLLVPAQHGITSTSTINSAEPPPLRVSARNVISPKPRAAVPSSENLDTSALRRSVDFVFLKIQDFGYAENDPRRQYDLTINLHDPPRPPSPAPPGFIPPMNMDETEESEASSDSGLIAGQTPRATDGGVGWPSKDSFDAVDYNQQPPSHFDLDPIDFTPGVYRALHPYEPKESAEMALEEDQEVTCLRRGGGEGWLVAVMEVTETGAVIQALVPEAHMQLIRPLEG